jgi:hypothetical protein
MERLLEKKESIADIVSLIAGACLFLAPWVLGYAATTAAAAWTAWVSGIVIAVLAIAALTRFAEWEEWVNGIVGLWVVLSPWILGFATTASTAAWTHVVLGLVVLVAAVAELGWLRRHGPTATA